MADSVVNEPDIAAFLRARYDEREVGRSQVHDEECSSLPNPIMGRQECDCGEPDFVLADVAAKRRIVDWCVEVIGDRDLSRYGEPGALKDDRDALAVTLAVETLRLLALPFTGHPDYREEWKP